MKALGYNLVVHQFVVLRACQGFTKEVILELYFLYHRRKLILIIIITTIINIILNTLVVFIILSGF